MMGIGVDRLSPFRIAAEEQVVRIITGTEGKNLSRGEMEMLASRIEIVRLQLKRDPAFILFDGICMAGVETVPTPDGTGVVHRSFVPTTEDLKLVGALRNRGES